MISARGSEPPESAPTQRTSPTIAATTATTARRAATITPQRSPALGRAGAPGEVCGGVSVSAPRGTPPVSTGSGAAAARPVPGPAGSVSGLSIAPTRGGLGCGSAQAHRHTALVAGYAAQSARARGEDEAGGRGAGDTGRCARPTL